MDYVRRACTMLGLLLASGCAVIAGLDHTYEQEDGGSPQTSSSSSGVGGGGGDGGSGGAGGQPVCEEQCPDAVPAGWVRVGYAPDRSTPCPSGFLEADIKTDAVVQADACICGDCQVTTPPSCDAGAIKTYNTNQAGPCKGVGLTLANSPAGQCAKIFSNGDPALTGSSFAGTPPPPVGGACSRAASLDVSKVQWTEGRICFPMGTTCDAEVCAGVAPFSECVLTDGDKPCPAPFSTRHVPGTEDDVMCGACGCTLNSTCEGTLTLYTDMACTAGDLDLPVTNACFSVNSSNMYYTYKYTGEVKLTKCAEEPPVQATFIPAQTLCCK